MALGAILNVTASIGGVRCFGVVIQETRQVK